MKNVILISVFSLLFILNIFGQDKDSLEEMKSQFQSFNYSNVISIAERLLLNKTRFSENEQIEIYLLKGISHYSLKQANEVKSSFYEILKLNRNYKIDPSKVSPKINNEFENIKIEYDRYISNKESITIVKTDTLYQVDTLFIEPDKDIYSSTMIRSLVYPGWGHLYSGHKTKGLILTSATTLTLGSMLYFVFDTNNKQSQYLNELDPELIDQKYEAYDTSYKIRNLLIVTYALIWIYAQIDILFISEIPYFPEITTTSANNSPYSFPSDIQFTMHFKL